MRISSISIEKLFGVFNHTIKLNAEERITIIHGPNGFGKTAILQLAKNLFSENYGNLWKIPFDTLSIGFDNGKSLSLRKTVGDENIKINEIVNEPELHFSFFNGGSHVTHITKRISSLENFPLGIIEREIEFLDRVGTTSWVDLRTGDTLNLSQVIDAFGERLPPLKKESKEPDWLKEIRGAISVQLIETQRLLLTTTENKRRRVYADESSAAFSPSVRVYSQDLAKAINEKLTEYGALSQSLDRTFPTRLVKSAKPLTIDKLTEQLVELEEKRNRLINVGLLEQEKDIDFQETLNETNRNVLTVYVDDVNQKLKVFDVLSQKIELLIEIINNRFLHKKISINKKDGFTFQTIDGKKLAATDLSSGEQHELVLLYDLLFKVKPNSLILIDEPELSLHIVWQQQFLKDLVQIIKVSDFDVLIATHSPQIIHDRWDLTVQLEGPKPQ